MSFSFWQRWLLALSVLVSIFGVFLALFNQTPVFNFLFNARIDPVFWGARPVFGEIRLFQAWVYGVLGATTAGWGVFLAYIARYPFKNKERWAWNCMTYGLLGWYLLDTYISYSFHVIFNVLFNTLLIVAAGLPLLMTRRAFSNH